MAVLIVVQAILGFLSVAWHLSPAKLDLFVWHKSIGLLVLILVAIRLLWRLSNTIPALPADTPAWQIRASRASHALLYLCIFALPVSGWVINSAANVPFRVFWLFRLPNIVGPDDALATAAKLVHGGFVALLLALLAIHIGAALYHHYVRRDQVLARMLTGEGDPDETD
jgi:cytochrome b561